MFRLKKIDQKGFDHLIVAVLTVVTCGVIGTALVVASHAYTVHWRGLLEVGSSTSGYCLSTTGGTNGSKAVLNPCSNTSSNAQKWSLNYIKHTTVLGTANAQEFTLQSLNGTTECLNDPYGAKTTGTQLQLYTCHSNDPNSLWVWGGEIKNMGLAYRQLINVGSISGTKGLCLDDNAASHAAGTKVQLWTCSASNSANQNWFEQSSSTSGSGGGSTGGGTSGGSGGSSGAPAMPSAAPSGFTRAFSEDFNTPAALGSFDSVYGSQFGEYTGCCSTNKFTQYSSSKVLYVQNGSMFYKLHSEGSTSYAAAPQPWNEKGFTYGQYGISVKLDSSTGPGYKIAFLLWPTSGSWSNEVDFPEVDPDFTAPVRAASLNYSPNGGGENGFSSQDNLSTGVYLTDHKYHTFLLTWTPGKMIAQIDGKTVATFTGNAVPSQTMRLSLQAEGWINQGSIPTSTTDVLEVPWVYINTYK